MRVGHLTGWLSNRGGGIPAVVFPLAKGLRNNRVHAPVFGLVEKRTEPLENFAAMQVRSFQPVDAVLFGYTPQLGASLAANQLDLLHQHGLWQYPSVACIRWQTKTSAPYLVSPHGMLDPWALGNSALKKRIAARLFQSRHLRGAACLHALNLSELRSIRKYGLQNPVSVIPNGISLPDERDFGAPAWAEQIPAGEKAMLFLGRLHPKKGLPELLRAWKVSAPVGWNLVIAGWNQGGHEEELKVLARELNILRSVRFVGPQFGEDKAKSYRAADAFALPSLSEGLPMTVLEAWSYRLPVLMTAACNLPEGFAGGAAIELPLDSVEMTMKLQELFELPDDELSRIGAAGRQLVEKHFTWSQIASDMAEVYGWILGGGTPPRSMDQ